MGRPPPPSFGQCPKENFFFSLTPSLSWVFFSNSLWEQKSLNAKVSLRKFKYEAILGFFKEVWLWKISCLKGQENFHSHPILKNPNMASFHFKPNLKGIELGGLATPIFVIQLFALLERKCPLAASCWRRWSSAPCSSIVVNQRLLLRSVIICFFVHKVLNQKSSHYKFDPKDVDQYFECTHSLSLAAY